MVPVADVAGPRVDEQPAVWRWPIARHRVQLHHPFVLGGVPRAAEPHIPTPVLTPSCGRGWTAQPLARAKQKRVSLRLGVTSAARFRRQKPISMSPQKPWRDTPSTAALPATSSRAKASRCFTAGPVVRKSADNRSLQLLLFAPLRPCRLCVYSANVPHLTKRKNRVMSGALRARTSAAGMEHSFNGG